VDVLAEHEGTPVVVQHGNLLAASFHPEMAGDARLHERLLDLVR
jgi:5'-phosphate synthase pdxT subunit